jgi:hypothetical protein
VNDDEQRWRRRPDVLWRVVLDGVLVLAVGSDDVTSLGGEAATVWLELAEPVTAGELAARLPGVPAAEVGTAIDGLRAAGLVEGEP